MFERYTQEATRVIFFARYAASQFGTWSIETEHLLLGLLRENQALVSRFLRPGDSIEAIRREVEERAVKTEGRASTGGFVDRARTWVQPVYEIPLYLLALAGLLLLPRRLAVLIVALLAYQTLAAIGFAGDTRYRVPWDFTLALAAAASVLWLARRARLED